MATSNDFKSFCGAFHNCAKDISKIPEKSQQSNKVRDNLSLQGNLDDGIDKIISLASNSIISTNENNKDELKTLKNDLKFIVINLSIKTKKIKIFKIISKILKVFDSFLIEIGFKNVRHKPEVESPTKKNLINKLHALENEINNKLSHFTFPNETSLARSRISFSKKLLSLLETTRSYQAKISTKGDITVAENRKEEIKNLEEPYLNLSKDQHEIKHMESLLCTELTCLEHNDIRNYIENNSISKKEKLNRINNLIFILSQDNKNAASLLARHILIDLSPKKDMFESLQQIEHATLLLQKIQYDLEDEIAAA